MKNQCEHWRYWLVAVVVACAAGWGCGNAEEATLGGGGLSTTDLDGDGDGAIDDVPEGVNDWFTAADLQQLADAGLPIYTGDNPPLVAGSYLADSLQIVKDSLGASGSVTAYTFQFAAQTSAGALLLSYESQDVDSSADNPAFVAGDGDCFSVFTEITGYQATDDCTYRRPSAYSACLDESGNLIGFAFGFLMKELSGDCSSTMPADSYRVIGESDGAAMRQ